MKKIISLFIVFLLFSSLASAQVKDQGEYAYLKIKTGDETITYEFDSILDFSEHSEKILSEIKTSTPANKKESEPNLTIEISITIASNNVSTTITGSVTAFYSTIIAAVKRLQTQLIAIATG